MIVVGKCSLTAHNSISCSLPNSCMLILEIFNDSCTKMPTPPSFKFFSTKFNP
jgi:hypothetical protein